MKTVFSLLLLLGCILKGHSVTAHETLQLQANDECCKVCISGTGQSQYDKASGTLCYEHESPCCFGCQKTAKDFSTPEVGVGVSGVYNKIRWSSVEKVTYILVQEGAEKDDQPGFSDNAAGSNSSGFYICTRFPGTVYFRGWNNDGCDGSLEFKMEVTGSESDCADFASDGNNSGDGANGGTSGGDSGGGGTGGDGTSNTGVTSCSGNSYLQDGECVCESGWSGSPDCRNWAWWKWLFTICGGVAAVASIAVSIHAFLHRRKLQKLRRDSFADIDSEDETPNMKDGNKLSDVSKGGHRNSYYDFSSRQKDAAGTKSEVTL